VPRAVPVVRQPGAERASGSRMTREAYAPEGPVHYLTPLGSASNSESARFERPAVAIAREDPRRFRARQATTQPLRSPARAAPTRNALGAHARPGAKRDAENTEMRKRARRSSA